MLKALSCNITGDRAFIFWQSKRVSAKKRDGTRFLEVRTAVLSSKYVLSPHSVLVFLPGLLTAVFLSILGKCTI